ncbi:MAG: Bifunctional protein HldE [Verrucomicrobiae bacterium]|nr:Bifunctional protein HldE [Verrucomicrobiae bacterium]
MGYRAGSITWLTLLLSNRRPIVYKFPMPPRQSLENLLRALGTIRVGVIGDFCVDAYWTMDYSASEASIETGLTTRPVRRQRYTLGGAGTIVNNLVALGVGHIEVFGVVGDDPFGRELERLLEACHIGHAGLLTQTDEWDTPVYVKPLREDREENRLDFGNFNRLTDTLATELLRRLETALPELDAVIINEQIRTGIHTPFTQARLNQLFRAHPGKIFIVDARYNPAVYEHCLHKLNDREATRLTGATHQPDDLIILDEARQAAQDLFTRWRQPVIVTRGARGAIAVDATGLQLVPGLHIVNPTDPVGAGDSFLAGLAAALATGRSTVEAATFGNFVAGVTVQKLFQTGTATPAEILAIGADPDYVYEPELADDPRRAQFWNGTEIEITEPWPANQRITHAIFDFDGTISTLRQGWEQVMEPVMVRAILGDRYASADETLYARVVRRVREFIDKTTGIQTLIQMQGLVRLVREFGIVPAADEFHYKERYLAALMELVHERSRKLRQGELDVVDFTVKGALPILRQLHTAGVKLYLASGTDEVDVRAEAAALGCAEYFGGHIHGAVGDVTQDAKRIVLDRILNEIGAGEMACVVALGDGPVEIRETRKRGGRTIGVASDEIRRYGLNPAKRSRLIQAGAQAIIPDFSQPAAVLQLLGVKPR